MADYEGDAGDDFDDDYQEVEEPEDIDEIDEEAEGGEQENVEILPAGGKDGEGGEGLKSTKRVTTPYMTKYERARILGTRALQIAMCAPVMVELEGETDPLQVRAILRPDIRRNLRPLSDRHEGVEAAQDPYHRPEVYARRLLRRLGNRRAHHRLSLRRRSQTGKRILCSPSVP